MCIIHLAVLLPLLFGSRGHNCPVNCKCEEYWASCNLLTCDDKIVTDIPLLSICHATARLPPFPVNYMSWFPSEL